MWKKSHARLVCHLNPSTPSITCRFMGTYTCVIIWITAVVAVYPNLGDLQPQSELLANLPTVPAEELQAAVDDAHLPIV